MLDDSPKWNGRGERRCILLRNGYVQFLVRYLQSTSLDYIWHMMARIGTNDLIAHTVVSSYMWLSVMTTASSQGTIMEWAIAQHGVSLVSMTLDPDNNIYIVGNFRGTVDFDPGAGVYSMTSADNDLVICKLTPLGTFLWARQINTAGADVAVPSGIHTDSSGVYVTGAFQSVVDFDPGPGYAPLSSGQIFYTAAFVLKLDTAGLYEWAVGWGGNSADAWSQDITTDQSGSVYVCGRFRKKVDFDPGPGTYWVSFSGTAADNQPDAFVLKLDSQGAFVWVRKISGKFVSPAPWEEAKSIDCDRQGNLIVAGKCSGVNLYFDTTLVLSNPGIFISCIDSAGNLLWIRGFGGAKDAVGSIVCDPGGAIFFSGSFEKTSDFDPGIDTLYLMSVGGYDAFICKLDSIGNLIWIGQLGGLGKEHASFVAVDSAGYSYVSGYLEQTVDFDPSSAYYNLVSYGEDDGFVAMFRPDGELAWAKHVGGVRKDAINSVAISTDQRIYLAGSFRDTADLNPGAGVFSIVSGGGTDAFISALRSCEPSAHTYADSACDSIVFHDETIFRSGVYRKELIAASGCDSLITMVVMIEEHASTTINATACNFYELNGHVYASSGTYVQQMPTTSLCDSVITLNLVIGHQQTDSISASSCYYYTSPSGAQVWTTSGTYSDTLMTSAGCDSVIVVDLLILSVDTSVTLDGTTLIAGAGPPAWYQWLDCEIGFAPVAGATQQHFTTSTSGWFAVVVTQFGCTDTSRCHWIGASFLRDPNEYGIRVYPNPTDDELLVDLCHVQEPTEIILTDLLGREIQREVLTLTKQRITLHSVSKGLYYAEVSSTNRCLARFSLVRN